MKMADKGSQVSRSIKDAYFYREPEIEGKVGAYDNSEAKEPGPNTW
jgi:hypothetical protein